MRRRWRRDGPKLVPLDEAPEPELAEAEVSVELDYQLVGPGAVSGTGVVHRAGPDADVLLGRRVLVPAVIPASEERDAPLVVNRQPDDDGVALWSHLSCPARWVLPLEDGLELPPSGVIAGRELANAYALVVAANTIPRAPVIVVGTTACAELTAQVASARNVELARMRRPGDDPRSDLNTGERIFVLVADADPELGAAVAEVLSRLQRPSVAVLAGVAPITLDLADAADSGMSLTGVPGAHPDLLAEVAAMVVKGQVDIDELVTVTTPDGQLGTDVTVVSLGDRAPGDS